jgi:broad specificity phosphatase PhoE
MPALLLIRHAQAGSRKDWSGEDRERPLTSKGLHHAAALVDRLAQVNLDRVMSSPYRRCIQTVEPLADAAGLEVEADPALAEGTGDSALLLARAVLADLEGAVALCTHGDVIPEVLVGLADEYHLDLGAAPRQEKGSVWYIDVEDGKCLSARYLPPPR